MNHVIWLLRRIPRTVQIQSTIVYIQRVLDVTALPPDTFDDTAPYFVEATDWRALQSSLSPLISD